MDKKSKQTNDYAILIRPCFLFHCSRCRHFSRTHLSQSVYTFSFVSAEPLPFSFEGGGAGGFSISSHPHSIVRRHSALRATRHRTFYMSLRGLWILTSSSGSFIGLSFSFHMLTVHSLVQRISVGFVTQYFIIYFIYIFSNSFRHILHFFQTYFMLVIHAIGYAWLRDSQAIIYD